MSIAQRLQELQIELPQPAAPVGAYVPAVLADKLLFLSGQLPLHNGKLFCQGKVPTEVSLSQAQQAARVTAINALAAVQKELGSLDQVRRIVRLEVYVNSATGFFEQAKVANAASELLHEIFGTIGQHARLAVGMAELPLNAPLELALIVQSY